MVTLEKLTNELNFDQTDEIIAGWWTTGETGNPHSSGSDDHYSGSVSIGYGPARLTVNWSFTHTWT